MAEAVKSKESKIPWQWNRWGKTTYESLVNAAKIGKILYLPVLRNQDTEAYFVSWQLARIPLVAPWQIPVTPSDGSSTPNIYGLRRRVRILHFKKEFIRPDGSKGTREFFLAEPAHLAKKKGQGADEHQMIGRDQVEYHLSLAERSQVEMLPGEYDATAQRTIKAKLCQRDDRLYMRYHGMTLILDSPEEWKRAGAEELVGKYLLVSVWPAGKTSYFVKPFEGFHNLNPEDGIKYVNQEEERTRKRADGYVQVTDFQDRKSWEAAFTFFDLTPNCHPTLMELRKIYGRKRGAAQIKEEMDEVIVINAALAIKAKEYMMVLHEAKMILEERITHGLSAFINIETPEDNDEELVNGVLEGIGFEAVALNDHDQEEEPVVTGLETPTVAPPAIKPKGAKRAPAGKKAGKKKLPAKRG